jgi:hypothetical protein
MRLERETPRAFSLLEVILAVGLFASVIVVLLALLPVTLRQSTESLEIQTALRLTDAVETEVRRLVAVRGFDAFAGGLPVMSAALDHGELLVAPRAGDFVRPLDVPGLPDADRFFLIELRRFGPGPLAFDADGAVLAMNVRISWPYRPLTTTGLLPVHPAAGRQRLSFNLALNR